VAASLVTLVIILFTHSQEVFAAGRYGVSFDLIDSLP
jgi:hypothetical protein